MKCCVIVQEQEQCDICSYLLYSQKLNEATSLLSATCDTFILTLDGVMKLVQDTSVAGEVMVPSSPKRVSTSSSVTVSSCFSVLFKKKKKSETKLTVITLKLDQNTQKVKRNTYFN